MARIIIRPEEQYKRINQLRERMQEYEKLSAEILLKRPTDKAWSMIEAAAHMGLAYDVYIPKIDNALSKINPSDQTIKELKSRGTPSYFTKLFGTKDDKIKFKLKTFKQFKPVLDLDKLDQNDIKSVFDRYYAMLDHLKNAIDQYQTKDVESFRFNSAVGPILRFNLAEVVEFFLGHNERHTRQMKYALKKVTANQ